MFPNATVAYKQKIPTGDGLSHIVIVIADYHGLFIKGRSQAICICFFLVCVLSMFVKVEIDDTSWLYCKRFDDDGDALQGKVCIWACTCVLQHPKQLRVLAFIV